MALLAQPGPDEPAPGWVFWVVVALLLIFVIVVILARLTS
jgi:hypothetical protein